MVSLAVAVGAAAAPTVAHAQFATLSAPPGPLTVFIGPEGRCQVQYGSSTTFEMYPTTSRPANCGTFLRVGTSLFNPGGCCTGGTALTPVSQSPVQGSGGVSDPVRVTTVLDAGTTGVRLTVVDSYVGGQEAYRTDVTVQNTAAASQDITLYRAADCYLQGSDRGFGFVDTAAGAVGCSKTPNNSPADRIEQWYPLTAGSTYLQAYYADVWSTISQMQPFPNTCRCTEEIDQGAGLSWVTSLAPGESKTFSHYTTFSPRGLAGPPPPPQPPAPSRNPNDTVTPGQVFRFPPSRRCVSRRNFVIRLVRPPGVTLLYARVSVNGRPTAVFISRDRYVTIRGKVLKRRRLAARVDLRGLPAGRFNTTIRAVTRTLKVLQGTRSYRTCARKGPGGRPRL